ncbi:aminoglycoside phosphotransferase family protein [Horticoccus luteus]|uniref:Aminoglycoside phosphotransferase family protein n=1 Tax=Horticoccus luteus TaxID=2862869 RepID=A0A8F9XLC1_9BACT|nr:aminoglycoside phosphotransferase family protein [Horticoccus luteus]QYM78879.1 aminoglycoside phosphotransferase family protein [Horticoccus luteus]
MSASPARPAPDLPAVVAAFSLLGRFVTGAPYGSGHINDTFVITLDQAGQPVRYILQRINERVFQNVPALMENIARVTSHLARSASGGGPVDSRHALTLVPARDGAAWHRDAAGGCWRCYLFIENARTYDLVENPQQACEAARAFGEFQRALVDLPGGRLHETIPHFHHTRRRFEALRRAVAADAHGRAREVAAEIDFAFARESLTDVLLDLQARGEIPERITHNDTKFNNVMLDDASARGVCVIDLDTVMPGLALYDFGDMVRSATNAAAEDEREVAKVAMRMDIFEGLLTGYAASAGAFLNAAERAHLVFSGKLITFEIGLRFLTDFLEGDVYFKTKRAGHNLDRCRTQFALVRSIEQQEPAMQALAERIFHRAAPEVANP